MGRLAPQIDGGQALDGQAGGPVYSTIAIGKSAPHRIVKSISGADCTHNW